MITNKIQTGLTVYIVDYRSEVYKATVEFVNEHNNIFLISIGDIIKEYKLYSETKDIFLTYNEAFDHAIEKINKEQSNLHTRFVEIMKRKKEFEKENNQQETK